MGELQHRPLFKIAADIFNHWPTIAAQEAYISPLLYLTSIEDNYYLDTARSVVEYALCNMTTFKGENARRIKKELNTILKLNS